jgi:hypothetical protein
MLRIYEISGDVDFKNNFLDSLEFIHSQFIEEGKVLTRAKTSNAKVPNLEVGVFESSFRSPYSTLINLTRRAEVLFPGKDFNPHFGKIVDRAVSECLSYPLACGEALRALAFPDIAIRLVHVPLGWLKEEKFIEFIHFFTHRFVFDFHAEDNNKWKLCSKLACEKEGEGMEAFILALSPGKETVQ